jgi:leader peptidase (prepilin peptidase)/N-methyltransferase
MSRPERSRLRHSSGRGYSRPMPREASPMTAPPTTMPIEKRTVARLERAATGDVQAAWAAAPHTVQILTIVAAVAGLSSSVSSSVPLASGLTIAMLVPAALVDWHQRRLPDAIVLAAAAVFVLALLGVAAFGTNTSLAGVGLGVAIFAGPLLVLHLVSPRAMGFGDVKTAAVLGMAIGVVDWGLAAWALTAAAASTALAGIARRQSALPLGPGLVAGALSGVVAAAILDLDTIGL